MHSLSSFFETKIDKSELSILLSIEKASIFLNEKLLNGGRDIHGSTGNENIQGEQVQKLDIIAHNLLEMNSVSMKIYNQYFQKRKKK